MLRSRQSRCGIVSSSSRVVRRRVRRRRLRLPIAPAFDHHRHRRQGGGGGGGGVVLASTPIRQSPRSRRSQVGNVSHLTLFSVSVLKCLLLLGMMMALFKCRISLSLTSRPLSASAQKPLPLWRRTTVGVVVGACVGGVEHTRNLLTVKCRSKSRCGKEDRVLYCGVLQNLLLCLLSVL